MIATPPIVPDSVYFHFYTDVDDTAFEITNKAKIGQICIWLSQEIPEEYLFIIKSAGAEEWHERYYKDKCNDREAIHAKQAWRDWYILKLKEEKEKP